MDISFSKRFENIVDITNAFIAHGKEQSEAREEAKFFESEILKNSKTIDEYQQLCNELLTVTDNAPHNVAATVHEPVEADEILNLEGPSYGEYQYSTFHRDGQSSTIYKAKAMSETAVVSIVALKVATPSQMQAPHDVVREARILVEARHEFVVPLIQSFWHHDQFILVFPFLRQDLENLLRSGSLTRIQIDLVFTGLFRALAHLHSLNVIHRDVKPSNILLKTMDGPVYLVDFGIAWSATDPQSERSSMKITDVGTTSYRPPELLFGDKAYDTSLDIWAAGCVVAEMVRKNHCPLFDAGPLGSELGLIRSIFTTLGTPDEQTWPSVTKLPDWGKVRFQQFPARSWNEILPAALPEAIDLVRRTVAYEGTTRLTALQVLEHPLAARLAQSSR